MSKIIGIDLGTSNSAAAVFMGGKPTIIPAAEGATAYGKAFPSIVAFSKDGDLLVGEPARRQAVSNPDNTIVAIKRKMGTDETVRIQDKEYKPQQISAFILQKIKKDAEAFTGEKIEKAVVTVPASFDSDQRQATKDAGTIAGLDVVRIINEPTAAALTYGLDKEKHDIKIMVFDFGGGTLDVTIMEMGGGVFKVIGTSGNPRIGGTDMDNVVIDYILDEFYKKEGIDLKGDITAMVRVREATEKAKIELSNVMETEINLPFIVQDSSGSKNLVVSLTRTKFEEIIRPIVEKTQGTIENAIEGAKLSESEIDKVVLVGGPTRIPFVRKFVGDVVGKEAESGIDPMEAVAMGAAVQAAVLDGDETDGSMMLSNATDRGVMPNSTIGDIVLLDVTQLSLGINMIEGVFDTIIERNTQIPVSKSEKYHTTDDNQTTIKISVFQGERTMSEDNHLLGEFIVTDIPPAPKKTQWVEVNLNIDASGIINATATVCETKKQVNRTIKPNKLPGDEITKYIEDANRYYKEDKKKKEYAKLKYEAEDYMKDIEKRINQDRGDNVLQGEKNKIIKAIRALDESLKRNADSNDLMKKWEMLRTLVNKT